MSHDCSISSHDWHQLVNHHGFPFYAFSDRARNDSYCIVYYEVEWLPLYVPLINTIMTRRGARITEALM